MKTKLVVLGTFLLVGCLVAAGLFFQPLWSGEKDKPQQGNRAQAVVAKPAEVRTGKDSPEGFTFSVDREGKLLANLLMPAEPQAPKKSAELPSPYPVPGVSSLERFEIPLAFSRVDHLPLNSKLKGVVIRPRPLPEEPVLTLSLNEAAPPQHVELPTHSLVRQPSPSVAPPPLPVLAPAQPDRVALDDPTKDVSGVAALAAPLPSRTNPVPFQPFNLPDPFENSRAVQLRSPPPEGQPNLVTTVPYPGR